MQTAPMGAANNSPRNSGQPAVRRTRRRLRLGTYIVAAAITIFVLGLMAVTQLGIWPPKTTPPAPGASVHSTSPYASMLKIGANGPVKKDPAGGQLTIPLTATNNLVVPPRPVGTPNTKQTPQPVPARVLAATVKVLCYADANGQRGAFQGEAYGGFSSQQGIAPGQTQAFQVQASGINSCDHFDAVADLISTDQDVVGTPAAGGTAVVTGGGTVIPLATTTATINP